ncbi:hypothetical protein SPI_07053 [Niveomyces insectorum RCEF 264]|uniref:HNH nuclease domain-containing protein n=1 Tax=Niveomyces insectorum RCEF 264 TaxID=1081102 RepID=A0A167Q872_9HYPO|nr:hypothetical protein SPI_07053 [Niveomyces insectorum RCEF 264]
MEDIGRRHTLPLQSPPEAIIGCSSKSPLNAAERASARRLFYRIVEHFEVISDRARHGPGSQTYSKPRLIRCTYEYTLSDESRDLFLRSFFGALALPAFGDGTEGDGELEVDYEELMPLFDGFAECLMDKFFSASPVYDSAVLPAQDAGGSTPGSAGTTDRLASLRGACLVRDRYRCVITRKFDSSEHEIRYKQHGGNARDEDGALLHEQDPSQFDTLEVAHILPHSLTETNAQRTLDEPRQTALAILNMLDNGVAHLINGADMDRPRNALTLSALTLSALTLSARLHEFFGAFNVYFDPVPGEPNTYRIQSFLSPLMTRSIGCPVTRTLFVTANRTIEPPSARLLAVHRAIAHILHLSGAGNYIDTVLRDMDDCVVRSDGSSDLGRIVSLSLGGWLNSAVYS